MKTCKKIHAVSLELLDRVGARLHLEEAIQLLKKAGAKVIDSNLVRIPSHLVENALATALKKIDLFDRHTRPAINLGKHNKYYGPGSDCLNIINHRNGRRRKLIVKDVVEGAILCDSLENIDFVMSMVFPSDVNQSIADRFQMEVMLNHTTKPIIFVSYDLSGCKDCVEMAEAVVGGEEVLQKNPLVACYINVPTGLLHNEDSLRKLLFLAEKNIPSLYIPSSTEGVTSPITTAGAVALDYAGVLVGLVLSQLIREGALVIIPGMSPGPLDMRDVKVTEKTLALDVIEEVGPEGNYLKTEHTRKYYKERWYPNLFERDMYNSWIGKGGKTLVERAADEVELILSEHEPESLPSKIKEKLKGIVHRANAS